MKKIWAKLSAKETLLFRLAFCVVLLVQLGMMLYFGVQKTGYHLDEMYTYQLSSCEYFAFYGDVANYDYWGSSATITDTLSADGNELFNFAFVYQNQVDDVHPPLYYFVINIAMSLCAGVFSKWIGIVPNMILAFFTSFAFYKASERLTRNKWLALCITAFYALSVGAMSTVVFIRMYAMLTLWVVMFLYVHARAFDEFATGKISKKNFAGLFVFTCCGLLTQYYFFIICFFACGGVCFYLLCRKAWKTLLHYAGVELAALVLSYLFFPAMVYHMFNGYRGEEAIENLLGGSAYFSSLRTVLTAIDSSLFAGVGKACALVVVGIAVVLLCRQKGLFFAVLRKADATDGCAHVPSIKRAVVIIGVLLALASGYIVMVVRMAPTLTTRYYMCIYPLLIFCFVYGVYTAIVALVRNQAIATAAVVLCCAVLCVGSYQVSTVDYLYENQASRKEILAEYQQTPVVVINCGYGNSIIERLYELVIFDDVFVCSYDNFDSLALANEDGKLDDGFLFYMIRYNFTDEERAWLLEYYLGFSSCEQVAEDVYYCER